ncbi:unnamed protein product [Mytilus edulis]|uniref:Ig-like domain-containing protein n=1 Tax=Mytilus edulis TaxID=6550 RepID=A0A8S3UVR9_MYTED|nr:unnamed protein product [Mytilus edulis]
MNWTLAATVSINQNITGLHGNTDTFLTCSFFLEKGDDIVSAQIIAKNITEDFDEKNLIAIFKPEKAARLLPAGTYLSSRVTLTNITNTSTNATLTFHVLKFTDEKDYMCKLFYNDMFAVLKIRESEATRISVKVQVRDVNIKNEPNQKQYDQKTDNITLTCKASGNPEPSYVWYKEDNKSSILSTTDLYVIEDVIRNNSGVYICQAYNIINNIRYNHSTSVEIDIVDKLPSESVSSKISSEKVESRCDCNTIKQDYIPVASNNTNTKESGDASNGLSENKISYRNKYVDNLFRKSESE